MAAARLAGKKLKEPGSTPVTNQEWDDAKARLNAITSAQPQYQKAQRLLAAMAAEDKKAAAAAEKKVIGKAPATASKHSRPQQLAATTSVAPTTRSLPSGCFVGPRGGTYTITKSGRKNYELRAQRTKYPSGLRY